MPQQDSSKPKHDISREELLHLLDSEIELISKQKQKEGWTTWAILGGLSTLGWFLWESLIKEIIQWENSITLILIFYLIEMTAGCVIEGAGLRSPQHPSKRYRHIDRFALSRSLLNIPIFLALIWFAFQLQEGVSLFAKTIAVFILAVVLLTMFAQPVFYYLQIPRSEFTAHPTATTISLYVIGGLCIYSAFSYWNHLANLSLYDTKVAAIIFAALFLLEKLNPLEGLSVFNSFVNIRRQLILGVIDVASAHKQVSVTIFGMEAGDIFQFELNHLRSKIASLNITAKDEQDILDEVINILTAVTHIDINTEYRARRLLETHDRYRRRYEKKRHSALRNFDRVHKRLNQFFFEADRKDLDNVLDTLQSTIHNFMEHARVRNDKLQRIETLLSPHEDNPVP